MTPLRIGIIVILVYIGYRLIAGGGKKKVRSNRQGPAKEMSMNDVLEEDPICRKLVPQQQAIRYESQGATHFFCSKECCDIFTSQQGV